VLTMEYSAGERVDLYAKAHPKAMPQAINTLVKLMLQSIFEEGLFHADPHPAMFSFCQTGGFPFSISG